MKLYLKDNKLIIDASGRVLLKIAVYSVMIILYIFGLSELLHNALETLFEIIISSVLLVAVGLYLFLSNSFILIIVSVCFTETSNKFLFLIIFDFKYF